MKRTIRCDSMVSGQKYGIAFYDAKDTLLECRLVSRPTVPVKSMTKDDRYVVEIDGKRVEMHRNNSEPHYLETKRVGVSGRLRNVRMTFFDIGLNNGENVIPLASSSLVVVSQPVRQRGNVNRAVTDNVIYLPGPVTVIEQKAEQPEKPNRADFSTKGKYDHAMKKWKQALAA